MNRSTEFRRDMRNRKIKKRQRKILDQTSWFDTSYAKYYCHGLKIHNALYKEKGGYFNKGYYGAIGSTKKTKTKNAYASHRHKGGYGKAILYCRHDLLQIQKMNQDLKEYYNTEREENIL